MLRCPHLIFNLHHCALTSEQRELLWWFFFRFRRLGLQLAFRGQAFGLGKHNGNLLEVGANGIFEAGLMEASGGVIHSDTDAAIGCAGATMNGADLLVAKELRHRVAAKGDDDLGIDRRNLPIKVVIAGVDFLWEWIAVAGGTAFYNIGDKHIRAL